MTTTGGPRFLRMRTYRDAVVVPRPTFGDRSQGAGVVRPAAGSYEYVRGSGMRRRGREYVSAPTVDDIVPTRRVERAVYAGFVWHHYGHFLLESLGRSWFEGVDDDTPFVWLPATADGFTPWMEAMLGLVGLGPDRTIVGGDDGPLEVGELLVPDQGFEVHRYLHPWFRERLARVDAAPDADPLRVWLGRSALRDGLGGVAEEAEIESLLADEGWTIVHPERLSLREQVDLLARASHVAGVEGSAFHTLLFVRGFVGTIDVFTRHDNRNFEIIAAAAGWDQLRHPLPGGRSEEWHRPSGARDVRWSGVDARSVVDTVLRSSRRPPTPGRRDAPAVPSTPSAAAPRLSRWVRRLRRRRP